MSIPQFNTYGFLPTGEHKATIEDIRKRFCSYGDINKRKSLFSTFEKYIDCLKKYDVKCIVYVDGSFVTKKDSPGDIDVLILYDFEYDNDEWQELLYDEFVNIGFRGLHVFSEFIDSYGGEDSLNFLTAVKGNNTRKGIVEVIL